MRSSVAAPGVPGGLRGAAESGNYKWMALSCTSLGILLTPLAVGMLVTSPILGWLSDRHGSRLLSSLGLLIAAVGLAGMALIQLDTPYWYIALVMLIMGGGSGLFNSPNTSAIMASVRPGQRGIAAGTRTMLMNTGGVFSIAFALAIVASTLPQSVMFQIFAGVTAGVPSSVLTSFMNGLHASFWLMTAISVLGAIVSALRGNAHPGGVEEGEGAAGTLVTPAHSGVGQ